MTLASDRENTQLENRLSRLSGDLPVLTPWQQIPPKAASVEVLANALRHDPFAAMQIFRLVVVMAQGRLLPQVKTLQHAISLLGTDVTLELLSRMKVLDAKDNRHRYLVNSVADSLVCTSLLKSWHDCRQIQWLPEDHWACLFDHAGWWLMLWLEPMMAQGIEYRLAEGESRNAIFNQCFGFDYDDWQLKIREIFQLPALDDISGLAPPQSEEATDAVGTFKYQALRYYLPISLELAQVSRLQWQSDRHEQLVQRAARATLIDGFSSRLKSWLACAARETGFAPAAAAILKIFPKQPSVFLERNGFLPASVNSKVAKQDRRWRIRGDAAKLKEQLARLQTGGFKTNAQIYDVVLDALYEGIGINRCFIALHRAVGNSFRVEYSRGIEQYLLMQNLSFKLEQNGIAKKMYEAPVCFWLKSDQLEKARSQLPEKLLSGTGDQPCFLKTFHQGNEPIAFLYCDKFPKRQLHEQEYKMFRILVAAANKALEQVKSET